MTFNLPDGLSESDLPGNRPEDIFLDAYIEDNWMNLSLFHDFLDSISDSYGLPPSDVHDMPTCNYPLMQGLLGYTELANSWEQFLTNRAAQEYYQ